MRWLKPEHNVTFPWPNAPHYTEYVISLRLTTVRFFMWCASIHRFLLKSSADSHTSLDGLKTSLATSGAHLRSALSAAPARARFLPFGFAH
jgi:hypothetical protein